MIDTQIFLIRNMLASGFMLVWVLAVAGIVGSGVCLKTRPRLSRFLRMAVLSCVVPYVLLTVSVGFWGTKILRRDLLTSVSMSPSITLWLNEQTVVIQDQKEIGEFQRAIAQATQVGSHHSHPVEKIRFALDQSGNVYSIGKDSQVSQEYWIQIEESKKYSVKEQTVIQIASPLLTSWLAKVHPR